MDAAISVGHTMLIVHGRGARAVELEGDCVMNATLIGSHASL
jgi:hypothetical protein